jgi:predicted RecB family nuclease
MSNSVNLISKTAFLKFEQCHKAFYFYKKHPYLRDKISIDKQLTFKRGHQVGDLAQTLFPGGIDVSKNSKNSAEGLALTTTLVEKKTPVIYEATFAYNDALIMVDILCLDNEKYTAYEVKSSFKISEVYLKDACLQYYVLKNALTNLEDLFLVTLNQDYVFENEIEPKKLFKKRSVKTESEKNLPYFENQLFNAQLTLEQNKIPNIAIGKHCFKPYQCDYFSNCWKDTINENSIFNLPLLDKEKLFEWYNSGIRTIDEIGSEHDAKAIIYKIKQAYFDNKAIVDKEKITSFLSKIQSPMTAMDMEMWGPAIPQINGTKPFEQLPYLVCFFDGKKHSNVFLEYAKDDRRQFAELLLENTKGFESILVYDGTMEKMVINGLIKLFADLKPDLEHLKTKFIDIFDIFLEFSYYHPAFKTNFSLKTVAGVLLEDINYSKITSGLEAMAYFDQQRLETNLTEKEIIKQELINYCQTDTLATYQLVDFLLSCI